MSQYEAMTKLSFGETVEGYSIQVLNEREIRAAAGILFLVMYASVVQVVFKWNFFPLKIATTAFLIDIVIRLFVSPRFSPTLIIGRWIVRNQVPEYVGAVQKRFAWMIGLILSLIMFVSFVLMNLHTPINGLICMICMVFLFFEAAFGICLGCKFYSLFYGKKAQYCPGEVCEPGARHAIQKVSVAQIWVVVAFVGVLVAGTIISKPALEGAPQLIWGMQKPE
jgi:hypothetical protein